MRVMKNNFITIKKCFLSISFSSIFFFFLFFFLFSSSPRVVNETNVCAYCDLMWEASAGLETAAEASLSASSSFVSLLKML